ncbi:hypothetical protein AX14_012222 [Amanita brunnescens Koide BX004]|nr:hypothetical protein AX14_012222 [Amanita brunnescens Koide BX004]
MRAMRREQVCYSLIRQGQDSSYIGTIEIGTPPKTFHLILDAGSSDFWVTGRVLYSTTTTACCIWSWHCSSIASNAKGKCVPQFAEQADCSKIIT